MHNTKFNRIIATIFVVMLCVQIGWIETTGISLYKVSIMCLSPLILLANGIRINKALIFGLVGWLCCFFCAYSHQYFRFSTLGYFGLYIFTFITYYSQLRDGVFTLNYFKSLLKYIIYAFGIVLIIQQICLLSGIRYLPIINLLNQGWLNIDKLPILTQEPSASARIMGACMLGYLRCIQLEQNGQRISFKELFSSEHKVVTILFLWAMVTMGSGTAFVAIGILSLYFITRKNLIVYAPILILLVSLGSFMEITNFKRAQELAMASTTMDVNAMHEADGSGASRIIPLVNTLTKSDLTNPETWFGIGTSTGEVNYGIPLDESRDATAQQYGLISFIVLNIFVYVCVIRRFFSIESLFYILLLGFTVRNFAYAWAILFIFAAVRYFQEQQEAGTLVFAEEELEEDMEERLIEGKETAN